MKSRYVMIFLHKKKSDYPELLEKAITQAGYAPKIMRTDGAGEYSGPEAEAIYKKHNIFKQTGNPHQQFQNGPSEKLVDTINKGTRTALHASNMPLAFWGYAAINYVDVYNHLPHSSLNMMTPWEAEKNSLPNVSWFRPFGCRATVHVRDYKNHVEHPKLSARGEACIYLGLGHSRGRKGWVCFNPETKRMYCTTDVVFDETFVPVLVHEQRIMGHYDPTPRTRFPTLIHGSMEAATQNSDDITGLPREIQDELPYGLEDATETELQELPCARHEHQEADFLLQKDDEALSFSELEQRQPNPPNIASGGITARASGGATSNTSGGITAHTSGGHATRPSGGNSAKPSGGAARKRNIFQHGGGANSGIFDNMLSAGKGTQPQPMRLMQDDFMQQDTYRQADIRGAVVYNSNDNDAWTKLGHLNLRTCNNGDLAEWMIGHDIGVILRKRFWTSDRADRRQDLRATVREILEHKNGRDAEVEVVVEEPNRKDPTQVDIRVTEILISQDPLVSGKLPLHRNCLREAIMDTYPAARKNANFTLQDLLDASYEFNINPAGKPLELPAEDSDSEESSEEDDDSEDENNSPRPATAATKTRAGPVKEQRATNEKFPPMLARPTSPGPSIKSKEGKSRKREQQDKEHDTSKPAGKRVKSSNSFTKYATRVTRSLITTTQAFFNIESNATNFDKVKKSELRFRMRNDTEGASFAAFYATIQVCAMAAAMGYKAEFLPLEPKNQRDARKRPDAEIWQTAEIKEQDKLWNMGTFQLVDQPSDYDPIPMQFVYKLKVKDGDYENGVAKARLVMMGNLQYEHEYGDTYAPTARLWVVRTLAAIAAQEGLTMKKFDLTGAFLIADMDRTLHVQIPGYDIPRNKALLLKKALYGGKSSGALYAKEIRAWLEKFGFVACSVDETLFRLTRVKDNKTSTLLISLYVDDGACCTNDEELYQEFIKALQAKYELSDVGDLSWHLGINVIQDLEAGTISFDQTAYIDSVIKRFNMVGCKTKHTPLPPKTYLTSQDCPATPDKKDVKTYQQLMGSLMYVACGTRPDIAFAVNSCAQFMQNPGESHLKAAKHILRYLNTTRDAKLTYRKQQPNMGNVLYGFVDADHAGSPQDRKSVGGYVLLLNGAAISWSSRKIKVVALSSFESEWYSASICGCEVVVVRRLLDEIQRGQTKPTKIFEDNAACIHSANSKEQFGQRSRHIDTRIFKLREFVEEKTLTLEKVCSAGNVADCLTKSLPREQVELARDAMMGKLP